jgi:hypothetical protein
MTNHTEAMTEGEPLGIFQNLPAADLGDWQLGEQDLAEMKRSVHELIHARAVEAAIDPSTQSRPRRAGSTSGSTSGSRSVSRSVSRSATLRIAAAFGAVALATSLLVPTFGPQPLRVGSSPFASYAPTRAELAAVEALPLVENLGSDIELIQIEDAEMSLVVAAIR